MKTRIHVNQHRIRSNAKTGSREPVITVKKGKNNTYGSCAIIRDTGGVEVARVIYSPDKPLSCGAKVWIETTNSVEIINNEIGKPQEV